MLNESISVLDAAKKMGIHKSSLFKILKRFNIVTFKEKSSKHSGQAIAYITNNDFNFVIQNYTKKDIQNDKIISKTIGIGVFYLIQLEPDYDKGRFKLGFTSNIAERLRDHRCSAPYVDLINSWDCHSLWEKTAIDCVTQNCEKLHTEVFRTNDIAEVEKKCTEFFKIMPNPNELLR